MVVTYQIYSLWQWTAYSKLVNLVDEQALPGFVTLE